MKISYRWLHEFLNFTISPAEIVDKLIMIGHEVEEVIDLGMIDNLIRTARVVSVEDHPDSDHLTICKVDNGLGQEVQVVCGAPNVAAGMISVLAGVGATLPNGLTLKRTKIRGVRSEGMLLALDEMGLGTGHEGIVELEPDTKIGEGYDLLLDLEITPNRPDCLSIFGLARELAAVYCNKAYGRTVRIKETYENVRDYINISIKCPEECPRYAARLIKDVKIGPSPAWFQRRLLSVGLRPINNVVDATNYVLMELGHPMHAFDYDNLSEKRIVVRLAEPDETIKIIDGSEVKLKAGSDMLITDGVKPIALAGVMGGFNSEVTPETTNVLLESAYFKPATIRLTSRRHNISTDASYRFERGTDQQHVTVVLDRATALIVELGGGVVPKGIADTQPRVASSNTLMLRTDRACKLLGVDLDKTLMADLLSRLGFEMLRSDRDMLVVAVPPHRVDISREEDLYEEIARMHGYDKIVSTMPKLEASPESLHDTVWLRRLLQDRLVALGLYEAINLSFIGESDLDDLDMPHEGILKLLNPMSREQAILRPDLTPSILRNVVYNQNRGNLNVQLFEISRTFHFGDMATPYLEKEALVIALTGKAEEASWHKGVVKDIDFFDLKGLLESLFVSLGIAGLKYATNAPAFLHPGRSARLLYGDTPVGWFGELGPVQRERLGLNSRTQIAHIELEALRELVTLRRKFKEIPRYPAIERDLALLLDKTVPAAKVEGVVRSAAGNLLESISLFDCYEGEQVPEGQKSLAYRLVYRHAERTLTDDEVENAQQKVLAKVEKAFSARLR